MFTPPLMPSPETVAHCVDEFLKARSARDPVWSLQHDAVEQRREAAVLMFAELRRREWLERPFEEPDAA